MRTDGARTVHVGEATVRVERTTVDGCPVYAVRVECKHSATRSVFVQPVDAAVRYDEQEMVIQVCQRALARTPCSCVRTLMSQYEVGF